MAKRSRRKATGHARIEAREARRSRMLWPTKRIQPGSSPGVLVADPKAHSTQVRVVGYGPARVEEIALTDPAKLPELLGRYAVLWVDVVGLADLECLAKIRDTFGLHPLAMEDVVDANQRPKTEDYADQQFIVTRMPNPETESFESEQLALFLGERYVVSFQERPGDCIEPVRERIRRGGRIRGQGADYLAYAILDAVIDAYYPLLERFGERIEALQDQVLEQVEQAQVYAVHALRRELIGVRRALWPQREMVNALQRSDAEYISDSTRIFLRDCYDHVVQIMDMIETCREFTAGLLDIYLSSMSTRMNEVMRVLTVIATIFIPLTFIVGVYGMNFGSPDNPWAMPELRWRYGYPAVMLGMAVIAGLMIAWFRKKRWL